MKFFYLLLALLFSSIQVKSQSAINFHPSPDHITVSGKKMNQYTFINKKDATQFVIAAHPGYVTFGYKSEDMGTLVDFYLIELNKPSDLTNSRKLEVVGIADLSDRVPKNVDLNNEKFKDAAATKLSEWGFDCKEGSVFFENTGEPAELSIAGEIVNFGFDTKGPGYQVSTIIKWSLYNINQKKITHSVLCAGYSDSHSSATMGEEICLAIKNSMQGLMSDRTFQSIVSSTPTEVLPSLNQSKIYLPIVKNLEELEYSRLLNQTTESVVTVQTNLGHGSGFIISKSGYLITNYHVVEGASSIELILKSGLVLEGTVVNFHEARDVALIKINAKGFKPIPVISKHTAPTIGMDVTAIGTPNRLELGQTVTKGIISGEREFEIQQNSSMKFLQIDVAINGGNSGGPLINNNGEIVGVVVAKHVEFGVEGIAYAIPIWDAIEKLNIIFE